MPFDIGMVKVNGEVLCNSTNTNVGLNKNNAVICVQCYNTVTLFTPKEDKPPMMIYKVNRFYRQVNKSGTDIQLPKYITSVTQTENASRLIDLYRDHKIIIDITNLIVTKAHKHWAELWSVLSL